MEKNIIVEGIVSATSDKQNPKFAKEGGMRKSIYFTPKNKEERQKLLDYGLEEYGEKEKFFILKASKNVDINGAKINCEVIEVKEGNETRYEGVSKNFSSEEKVVALALFEGENVGNRFVRAYAIKGHIAVNEIDAFADYKTDVEDVETDASAFSKATLDINTDDLPF